MEAFIPLHKTIQDFQERLKMSALTGKLDITLPEIIQQLRDEPVYDLDKVVSEVVNALVADNPRTNCVIGNDTEHVVVTKAKLNEIINIIKFGGIINASCRPE